MRLDEAVTDVVARHIFDVPAILALHRPLAFEHRFSLLFFILSVVERGTILRELIKRDLVRRRMMTGVSRAVLQLYRDL